MNYSLIFLALMLLPVAASAEAIASVEKPTETSSSPLRAQLKARQSTVISSEMNARINQLKLRDGDHFNDGQTLVSFNCTLEEAQLNKAKATLEKAVKTYEVKQRLEELHSIGALELAVAKAEEGEAKADMQVAQAVTSRCAIKAPFSGKVTDVTAKTYQTVKAGDPLLEILDDKDLEVEFMAPSTALPELTVGRHFKVTLNETNKAYQAEITRLGGKVDPVSQTIKVYGRIIDKASELLPGMSGAVELNAKP